MLLWMLHRWGHLLEHLEPELRGEPRVYLTARTALASLTAFFLTIVFGPRAIAWLRSRFRERIASDSAKLDELMTSKQNTPTMGGLFILLAMLISLLLWCDFRNPYAVIGVLTAAGFCAIGAVDDWVKLSSRRKGLSVRQKFLLQTVLSVALSIAVFLQQRHIPGGTDLFIPWGSISIPLGLGFVAWGVLVLVGSSNAVNLTDGLDGLAAGCIVLCGGTMAVITYLSGHRVLAEYLRIPPIAGSGELAVVMGAAVGAALGFLWFNAFPAQVFMGDTGALPLGGLIGLAALASRQELLLIIAAAVFVVETLSVIIQVASFRTTGRRVLRCSPLHNHFLFAGEHEVKIVVRFWIAAALAAILAVTSLQLR